MNYKKIMILYVLKFQVVVTFQKPLHSAETCEKLNLLQLNLQHVIHHVSTKAPQKVRSDLNTSEAILKPFEDVFEGMGALPGEPHLVVWYRTSSTASPPNPHSTERKDTKGC